VTDDSIPTLKEILEYSDELLENPQVRREAISSTEVIRGGLIGISSIALIQLVGVNTPIDTSLTVATCCFSIAIPFLCLTFMLERVWPWIAPKQSAAPPLNSAPGPIFLIIYCLAMVSPIVGLAAIVFHISELGGVIFVVASLCCVAAFSLYGMTDQPIKQSGRKRAMEWRMNMESKRKATKGNDET